MEERANAKDCILHVSICMKCPQNANHCQTENKLVVAQGGGWGGGGEGWGVGMGGHMQALRACGVMNILQSGVVVKITQLCKLLKIEFYIGLCGMKIVP